MPNPHGDFALKGRRGEFNGGGVGDRSLVLRRGVADGVMDMFVSCVCC
jgi:hypothetical protein